jgi:hypothetical protein
VILLVFAALAVVLGATAGLSVFLLRGSGSADSAVVTLTLRATPLETTFRIDDGTPVENPFIVKVPRDGKVHRIQAAAPGFTTKAEDIPFDADRSIRFALLQERH